MRKSLFCFRGSDIEVGTGGPGYKWVSGYYEVTHDGATLYPGQPLSAIRKDARKRGLILVVCESEEQAKRNAGATR